MRNFQIILAMDSKRGIGKNGTLPWRIKKDMDWFKKVTTEASPGMKNAVIMGRKTWESIPEKFRPLPNRVNIIVSDTMNDINHANEGYLVFKTLDQALKWLNSPLAIESVFVIGGGRVYNEALRHPCCKNVILTEVHGDFECDTFIDPIINDDYNYTFIDDQMEENGIKFTFCTKARWR